MDNLILMSTFEKFPTSNTQKLVNSNSLVIPLAEMSRTVYHKSILPLPFCTLHVYLEKTIAKSCRYWWFSSWSSSLLSSARKCDTNRFSKQVYAKSEAEIFSKLLQWPVMIMIKTFTPAFVQRTSHNLGRLCWRPLAPAKYRGQYRAPAATYVDILVQFHRASDGEK